MSNKIRDKTIDISRSDDTGAKDAKRSSNQGASEREGRKPSKRGSRRDDEGSRRGGKDSPGKRGKPRRSALNIIVLLILIAVGGVFVWREMEEQFPRLPEGIYLGVVSGVFSEDGSDNTPVIILSPVSGSLGPTVSGSTYPPNAADRLTGTSTTTSKDLNDASRSAIKIIMVRQGWEPIDLALTSSRVLSGALPILVQGQEGHLKFSGKGSVASGFSGSVKNVTNGSSGSWRLQRVDERISEGTGEDLRSMLSLKAELIRVEERVKSLSQIINEQEVERRDLDAFLSQDPQQNSEYQMEAQEKLGGVQRKLKEEQEKLFELNNKLQLAQKLSPAGKLYALSRGVLDKEGELIDLVLQGQLPVTQDSEEMDLVKKGEEVLRIRREIELEREKIRQLLLAGETDLRQFE